MSYHIEALDEGRILIITLHEDFDVHTEIDLATRDIAEHLDAGPDQVVQISDARKLRFKELKDMLVAASSIRRQELKQVISHPKLLKRYSVIDNKLTQAALKGMNSATFGFYEITVFETVEEALIAARVALG